MAGRKVGVTANSHKVIGHLLDGIVKEARGATVRTGQKTDSEGERTCQAARGFADNAELLAALQGGELDVVVGTAWVWSREEFAGTLDVLVIDEAGQIALANAIAVSPAARSLVLLGDPQQLDQPLKGTHPPGAARQRSLPPAGDGDPIRQNHPAASSTAVTNLASVCPASWIDPVPGQRQQDKMPLPGSRPRLWESEGRLLDEVLR